MNSRPSNDIFDRTLDELLRRQSVVASADFTADTLRRIHAEAALDPADPCEARLEALLESQPIPADDAFTDAALEKIRKERFTRPVLLRFPVWASSLAAALAIGLFFSVGSFYGNGAEADVRPAISSDDAAQIAYFSEPFSDAAAFLDADNLNTFAMVASLPL